MTSILISLSWALAVGASLPLLVFILEVLIGIPESKSNEAVHSDPVTCILIPAHDESATIEATLVQLRPLLPANAYVLVIADNCSDSTADIVRSNGFDVVERFDAERRGKGYALAHGRDWLRQAPPECVVIFDADCSTDAKSLADLISFSVARKSVIQAGYVFEPAHMASPNVQISNFALWVKNIIRQRGVCRLGGMAILTGTGMAFPWKIFADLPLDTASIVEDLALTIFLAHSGKSPAFLNQARVSSFAAAEAATLHQRSRWEHGFLGVAKEHGISTLLAGICLMDRKLVLLGLHLLVPPLALLLMITILTVIGLTGMALFLNYWTPVLIVTALLAFAAGAIILAWLSGGHKWLNIKSLILLPMYLVWKIPVYMSFVFGRTTTWVRTDRDIHS